MGTRADFYENKDSSEGWLGSVAWDGYPDGVPAPVMEATSYDEFRTAVALILTEEKSASTPATGWPWPWDDSQTTDYAYVWSDDGVKVYEYGRPYPECPDDLSDEERDEWDLERTRTPKVAFPDMSAISAPTLGDRSGVIVFGG